MRNRNLIHPGEILQEEFLLPLGISQTRLALDLHVPAPRINAIVRGKRAITADTALRLGQYFKIEPQFWLNLQANTAKRTCGVSETNPDKRGSLTLPAANDFCRGECLVTSCWRDALPCAIPDCRDRTPARQRRRMEPRTSAPSRTLQHYQKRQLQCNSNRGICHNACVVKRQKGFLHDNHDFDIIPAIEEKSEN